MGPNDIRAIRHRVIPVGLQLHEETTLITLESLLRGTGASVGKDEDGLYLLDDGDVISLDFGDHLVRIGDDVNVYDAPDFQDLFVVT